MKDTEKACKAEEFEASSGRLLQAVVVQYNESYK